MMAFHWIYTQWWDCSPTTDEWLKKMWYLYTVDCYPATKRSEIGSFLETWVDPESVIRSEVSQRKTNIVY